MSTNAFVVDGVMSNIYNYLYKLSIKLLDNLLILEMHQTIIVDAYEQENSVE